MLQNKEKLEELLGQYWDIAFTEGSTGVSRGDEAGAVLSAIHSLLDQPEEPEETNAAFLERFKQNVLADVRRDLAKPEGEPVAYLAPWNVEPTMHSDADDGLELVEPSHEGAFPVYTHPPAPHKPITAADVTDEMVESINWRECRGSAKKIIAAAINAYLLETQPDWVKPSSYPGLDLS